MNESILSSAPEKEFHPVVLKYLNGRKQLITLDSTLARRQVHLGQLSSENQLLMIFSIILIKNTNNLLLELGPLAVKAFFYDVSNDLLKSYRESQSSPDAIGVLGVNTSEVLKLVQNFCIKSDSLR
jgi:hypothetical protein